MVIAGACEPKEQSYDGNNELAEGWDAADKTVEDIRRLGNAGVSTRGKDFWSFQEMLHHPQ